MTSVSAGYIILTPTQPVGSGRPQRGSNPGPPDEESRALPTELPRPPTVAEGILYDCLQDQASDHPDAVRLIMGDFNHCNLKSTCPHLEQYVTCPTRQRKTLDLCYGNVKKAYKSTPLPSLGESDHNNVLLTPSYKPAYKRTKPTFKTVRVWTRETAEELKDCFGSTDWDLFVRKTLSQPNV